VLLTVAAMMALGVAGQAWADPPFSISHNCAGATNSTYAPEGQRAGKWGTYIRPIAHDRQADEEAHIVAADGKCGSNSVP
jgi:hypothetical protein